MSWVHSQWQCSPAHWRFVNSDVESPLFIFKLVGYIDYWLFWDTDAAKKQVLLTFESIWVSDYTWKEDKYPNEIVIKTIERNLYIAIRYFIYHIRLNILNCIIFYIVLWRQLAIELYSMQRTRPALSTDLWIASLAGLVLSTDPFLFSQTLNICFKSDAFKFSDIYRFVYGM
jgi:hypothetical protein